MNETGDRPREHDALDGIPTPAESSQVIGHDAALATLETACATGRMHHAWLLQGPRGIGKATLAFSFATRLLANVDGKAAMDRDLNIVRRQIAGRSHPNLLHVTRPEAERSGFKTQITVDEIRKLARFFQATATGRQWRIALIDPVDDLNRNAANALLKMLEEPPERSLFLITNHLPGRLLPTIRSRCRVLRIEALQQGGIEEILGSFALQLPAVAAKSAAAQADGSVRQALTLLTSGGLEVLQRLRELLDAHEPEWHGIQSLLDELVQRGREGVYELAAAEVLRSLAAHGEREHEAGHGAHADDLARLWSEENARFQEGLLFNLDRKQMLLTHFAKRFALTARRDALRPQA